MYNIGICDDGENICASVENMLLKYAEKKAVQVDVQVWYTGEKLRDYLARGNHLDIRDFALKNKSPCSACEFQAKQGISILGIKLLFFSV